MKTPTATLNTPISDLKSQVNGLNKTLSHVSQILRKLHSRALRDEQKVESELKSLSEKQSRLNQIQALLKSLTDPEIPASTDVSPNPRSHSPVSHSMEQLLLAYTG